MTVWLTMSCKTAHNTPSYYSYLKLAKLYVVFLERPTHSSYSHGVCEANDYVAFNDEVYLVVLSRKIVMALISDQRVV